MHPDYGILFSTKKKWAVKPWKKLKSTLLNERSQSEKAKYYMIPTIWHSESESHSVMSDSLWPYGLYSLWNSLGQNALVVSRSLVHGIIPSQGPNSGLPHCRQILYQLSHKGSPRILEWEAYPFSRRSFRLRNQTGISCTAGRFFINWAIREAPKTLRGIKIKSRMSFPC